MTTTREQNYVTFYSPGTLTAEHTKKPIENWDIPTACRMAKGVVERHSARPFAFVFSTDILAEDIDDGRGGKLHVEPKEIKHSGFHHLGGVIRTLADVERDNKVGEEILRSNMRCNKIAAVVENRNSYLATHPFAPGDVLVDPDTGAVLARAGT